MNHCIKCGIEFKAKEKRYTLCEKCYKIFDKSKPTDYQLLVNKNTPEDVRRKMNIGDIRNNSIMCNKCGDIIRSKNRHNYVMCKCGNCGVDGGSWYCKIIGNDYTSLSEAFDGVTD